jgi:hypothetical protein
MRQHRWTQLGAALLLVACGSDSGSETAFADAGASGGRGASGGGAAGGGATSTGGASSTGGSTNKGGAAGASGGASGIDCRTTADCPVTDCFGCPGLVCEGGHCVPPSAGGASGSGGARTGTGGAGTGGSVAQPACPASPPSSGSSCAHADQACFYENCTGAGRTAARCTNGAWSVETGPCEAENCGMSGTLKCNPGQVCMEQHGGALITKCVASHCEGLATCECIEGCSGECTVDGNVNEGITVRCNLCPGLPCP